MKKIFVINGPNLDMLGVREPEIYGKTTIEDVKAICRNAAKNEGYEVEFMQFNCEGKIVEALHTAYTQAAAVIINAAAYTHYSYAIADAVKMLSCPVIELHISNVFAREQFRHGSVMAPYVTAVISGAGTYGYALAIMAAADKIKNG